MGKKEKLDKNNWVIIRIWRAYESYDIKESAKRPGHVSLETSDGLYVSLWPETLLRTLQLSDKAKLRTLNDDLDKFRKPHKNIILFSLDISAIKFKFDQINPVRFNKLGHQGENCSTIIFKLLKAGWIEEEVKKNESGNFWSKVTYTPEIIENLVSAYEECERKNYSEIYSFKNNLLNAQQKTFKKQGSYDYGHSPTIAINDDNLIVEAHSASFRNRLWYRVGEINENNEIIWGESYQCGKDNTGAQPAIAIYHAHVLLIFRKENQLYARYGKLNVETKTIGWFSPQPLPEKAIWNGYEMNVYEGWKQYGLSNQVVISVSVNNKGQIVAAYDRIVLKTEKHVWKDHLCCLTGQLSSEGMIWNEHAVVYDKGVTPSISINNKGLVLEFHKSENRESLYYGVGTFQSSSKEIRWDALSSHQELFDRISNLCRLSMDQIPSVTVNDNGDVWLVGRYSHSGWGGYSRKPELFFVWGKIDYKTHQNREISWIYTDKQYVYDVGVTPRIASNASGQVIEVHVSGNFPTLWCDLWKFESSETRIETLPKENRICCIS